jgi:hypothetical protein
MVKLLVFLMVLCVALQAKGKPTLSVFSFGARSGEVEPCGCPRVQLGGLGRLGAFLDQQAATKLLIDPGNSFFELPTLPPSRHASALERAELIAGVYRLWGVQAFVPGPKDLALGKTALDDLLLRSGAKALSANFEDGSGKLEYPTHLFFDFSGRLLGLTALSPGLTKPRGSKAALLGALKEIQKKTDLSAAVVSSAEDLALAQELGFSFVVGPLLQAGGKSVLQQEWDLQSGKARSAREVELTPKWAKANRATVLYEAYLKKTKEKALSTTGARKSEKVPGSFVAQAETCRSCHAKQHDFWETTKHASAYLVLFARNEHFNPECIACHSVGFGDPKGFNRITEPVRLVGQPERQKGEEPLVEKWMKEIFEDDSQKALDSRLEPERYQKLKKRYHSKVREWHSEGKLESLHMGVQCENCHGNRAGHPGPGFRKVGKVKEKTCTECHHPPHDESFQFKARLPLVACPRN